MSLPLSQQYKMVFTVAARQKRFCLEGLRSTLAFQLEAGASFFQAQRALTPRLTDLQLKKGES